MSTNAGSSREFVTWLEEIISDRNAGYALPTIRELSRRFQVSLSSVRRWLKPYIDDGKLDAVQGRGIFVTSRTPRTSRPDVLRSKTPTHSIATAVTEDIAAGKLKHGDPLPAVKTLAGQFRTNNETVTGAYRLLQERGLVRKIGRFYWVGGMKSIQAFGSRKIIPCFNFSEGDSSDLTAGNEIANAYENFERELHNHGLCLQFEPCEELDLFLRPDAFAKSDCAGVVLSGITVERFDILSPLIEALGPALARSGRRVLTCGMDPERRVPRRTHYFCHGTIQTNIVRTAAEYSLVKGFEDVVLILREAENNISEVRFFIRFISESLARNPQTRIRLLIQPLNRKQSPEQFFKRDPSYRLHHSFIYLEGLLSKYAPLTMHDLFAMTAFGDSIDSLFSRAPRGALWLTPDVPTAIAAAGWCEAHRIPVPSGAAILCFDDNPTLRRHGIASCVPDWNTIGYLMAHALIGDIPIQTSRRGFIRTPALLYERSTMP